MSAFVGESKQGDLLATLNTAGVAADAVAAAVTAALNSAGAAQGFIAGDNFATILTALTDKKNVPVRFAGLKVVKAVADAQGAVCGAQLVDLLPTIFGMYVSNAAATSTGRWQSDNAAAAEASSEGREHGQRGPVGRWPWPWVGTRRRFGRTGVGRGAACCGGGALPMHPPAC